MKVSPQLQKPGVQYLVKEDNRQSNLLIKQFRILLYSKCLVFAPLVLQLIETAGVCLSLFNLYVIKLTKCSISIFHIFSYAQSWEKISP